MAKYSEKKFPCGECGKMVCPSEKHTYEDCVRFKIKNQKILTTDEIMLVEDFMTVAESRAWRKIKWRRV